MRADWPGPDTVTRRRAGASTVALDDNVALYDDVGQLLIMLNASAAAVWERCDGTTPFAAMVADLAAAHGTEVAAITDDVWQTVRKLVELGLAEDAGARDATAGAAPA